MPEASLSDRQFQRLSAFIEGEVGIKMPPVKRIMLEGRLRKRLRALSMSSFDEYVDYVFSRDDGEIVHMIDVVTTNKTDFFREPEHFEYLSDTLLPRQVAQGWGIGSPFLAWSAASSTGEEAYSLAVTFEEFRRTNSSFSYRILGTDISTAVLHTAEKAVYPASRIQPVSQILRKRYFLRSRDRAADLVRVRPEVRQNLLFKRLNLMQERYPLRDLFHVIFCRNVIIYFDRPRQEALLRRLCNYLVPGGYLFLGHSESMASSNLPFESVAPTVYRRLEGVALDGSPPDGSADVSSKQGVFSKQKERW